MFRGLPLRYSDSTNVHLAIEKILPETLYDMISHPVNCPENAPKPHRRTAIRICAERRGRLFVIMLERDYTNDIHDDAYVVTHLKPI